MKVITCEISGLLVLEPKVFTDNRGFFLETWNKNRYHDFGLGVDFVQDNLSFSKRGILRGLHFQNPNSQGKLVQVLQGEVFDVAVDVRRSSPPLGGGTHWCFQRRRSGSSTYHTGSRTVLPCSVKLRCYTTNARSSTRLKTSCPFVGMTLISVLSGRLKLQ
jgi:dTDP-4-dehydrorhamnose 3,5-epimerase-like enzyme